jgi:hypothetical protein
MPSDGPINICPFDSPTQPISAEKLLVNFVDEIARNAPKKLGIIMFAPEHVRILSKEGWTEDKVKNYILSTGFNPKITAVRKEGFTTRGPIVEPRTFGLTRLMKKSLLKDPIMAGEDPEKNVFIAVAGAPVGGHGCLIPMASHGGWSAREVGTLLPPPISKSLEAESKEETSEYELFETKCGD